MSKIAGELSNSP
jgi:hypothetical protein